MKIHVTVTKCYLGTRTECTKIKKTLHLGRNLSSSVDCIWGHFLSRAATRQFWVTRRPAYGNMRQREYILLNHIVSLPHCLQIWDMFTVYKLCNFRVVLYGLLGLVFSKQCSLFSLVCGNSATRHAFIRNFLCVTLVQGMHQLACGKSVAVPACEMLFISRAILFLA